MACLTFSPSSCSSIFTLMLSWVSPSTLGGGLLA